MIPDNYNYLRSPAGFLEWQIKHYQTRLREARTEEEVKFASDELERLTRKQQAINLYKTLKK